MQVGFAVISGVVIEYVLQNFGPLDQPGGSIGKPQRHQRTGCFGRAKQKREGMRTQGNEVSPERMGVRQDLGAVGLRFLCRGAHRRMSSKIMSDSTEHGAIRRYYSDAGGDYQYWGYEFNMHFGFW